jgi:hypothetical protein
MKGFDVAPIVQWAQTASGQIQDALTHSWPVLTAGAAVVAACARWGRSVLRAFGYGYERYELVQQRDEARSDADVSAQEVARMRGIIIGLRQDIDSAEAHGRAAIDDAHAARAKLREVEDILDLRAANEWLLYQDREHAMNWGRTVADRLAVLGEAAALEPPLLGIPVAEPDEIVKRRFERERDLLAQRFQATAHRASEISKIHPTIHEDIG